MYFTLFEYIVSFKRKDIFDLVIFSYFFFIMTSEISRPDGIDKAIYCKQFGNFRRCAGFRNLTKEPVRRRSEPSTLYNLLNLLSTAYGDYCSSRRQKIVVSCPRPHPFPLPHGFVFFYVVYSSLSKNFHLVS